MMGREAIGIPSMDWLLQDKCLDGGLSASRLHNGLAGGAGLIRVTLLR